MNTKDQDAAPAATGHSNGLSENTPVQPDMSSHDGYIQIAEVLSQNLRVLMEERGINQAELARRAQMAVTSVNRVFNALDNKVSPRLETVAGIARGLGVHASVLLQTRPSALAPSPHEPQFTVARQLSRLVEDFLVCAPAGRADLLRLAADASIKSSGKQGRHG